MGCPLDVGDNVKIEKYHYALGQGGICGMHAQKLTKFKSKGFKK